MEHNSDAFQDSLLRITDFYYGKIISGKKKRKKEGFQIMSKLKYDLGLDKLIEWENFYNNWVR